MQRGKELVLKKCASSFDIATNLLRPWQYVAPDYKQEPVEFNMDETEVQHTVEMPNRDMPKDDTALESTHDQTQTQNHAYEKLKKAYTRLLSVHRNVLMRNHILSVKCR